MLVIDSFCSMTAIPATSWHNILDELCRQDAGAIRAWLYDLDPPELHGGVMTLCARNEAQLRYLDRCRGTLARCAQIGLGRLVSLDFQLHAAPKEMDAGPEPCDAAIRADRLMEHFVVGPENQLAHAAALRFLHADEADCNPLFIHGPSGAGKTHLLQAMCSEWSSAAKPLRGGTSAVGTGCTLYKSAERFVAEFTEAREYLGSNQFREQFGHVDLVALDDVGFFSGKSRSQEELFHVINGLQTTGKRLVLAADRPPAAISGLEPRLVSRFGAGLVIAMDPPSAESRLRVIEQKNSIGAYQFSPPALRQIAERCSPVDLDRVLERLDELARSSGGSMTMDLVHEVFRKTMGEAVIA